MNLMSSGCVLLINILISLILEFKIFVVLVKTSD